MSCIIEVAHTEQDFGVGEEAEVEEECADRPQRHHC